MGMVPGVLFIRSVGNALPNLCCNFKPKKFAHFAMLKTALSVPAVS